MLGGNLRVRLSLDDDSFNRGLDRARRGVGDFSSDISRLSRVVGRTESSIGMMGNTLRNVTMDVAILRYAFADLNDIVLAVPRAIIQSAAQFEKTTKLLEGLSAETDKTAKKMQAMSDMKFLVNMAVNSPFDMKALSNSFVKFRAAGLDPTNNSLQALVDSVAKFGGGSDELNRASVAIAQMSGKGVVSMEELRQQLGEAVPNAIQLMSRGLGMGMAELVKLISKGVVESKSALAKMFIEMRIENDGAAAEMMKTWSGMTQALSTKWDLFKNDIAQEGFFQGAKDELGSLLEAFDSDQMSDIASKLGKAMAQITSMLAGSVQFIMDNFDAIVSVLKTLGTGLLLGGLTKFFAMSERESSAFFQGIKQKEMELAEQHRKATMQKEADLKRLSAERQSLMRQLQAMNSQQTASDIAELRANQEKSRQIQTTYNRHVQAEQKLLAMRASAAQQVIAIQGQIEAAEARLAKARQQKKRQSDIKVEIAELKELQLAKQREVESTRFAFEANKAKIVQHQQEIAALRERYREVMKNSGATSASAQIIRTEIAATEKKIETLKATTVELQKMGRAQRGVAGISGIMAAGIGRATMALRGLIASMVTMTASVAGWTIFLGALAFAWDKISKAIWGAKEAQEAFENRRKAIESGRASSDMVKTLEEEIKELEETLNSRSYREGGVNNGFVPQKTKELQALKAQLAEARQQVLASSAGEESQFGSSFASKMRANANSEVGKTFTQLLEINKKIAAVQNATDKESIATQKKLRDEAKEIKDELYDKEIAALQLEIKNQETKLSVLKEGTEDFVRAQARIESLSQAVINSRKEQEVVQSDSNLLNGGAGKDKTKKPAKVDAIDKIRAEAEAAISSISQADGAITTFDSVYTQMLSKLNSLRGASKDSIYKQLTDSDLQMIALDSALPKIIGEANSEMAKMSQESIKLDEELRASLENLGRQSDGLSTEFNDAAEKARVSIAIYQEAIEALQAKRATVSTEQERARIDGQIGQLQGAQGTATNNAEKRAQIELNALQRGEQERIRALRESMLSGTQAREAAYQREIKLIEENYADQIKLAFAASQDIEAIEQAKMAALAQLRESFERDSMSGLNNLRDQWLDVGQQLSDASVGWANSISDGIVEGFKTGRFEVQDILLGILNDVLRINTQKTIAEPIAETLRTGVSGLGNIISGGAQGATQGAADSGMFDAIKESVSGVVQGMQGFLGQIFGTTTGLESLAINGAAQTTTALAGTVVGMATEQAATAAGVAAKTTETATVLTFQAGLTTAIATLAGFVGALQAATAAAASSGGGSLLGGLIGSANGNIVSAAGAMPLRAYASGGIANKPQLSLFGEGRLPEAYVPLPDGRTIPVTMNAASFGFDKIQAMLASMASAMTFMTGGLASSLVQMRQSVTRVPEQAVIQGVGASKEASPTKVAAGRDNAAAGAYSNYIAQQSLNIEINMETGATKTSGTTDFSDRQTAQALANRIKAVVKEELLTQKRPGGMLSR